jgi:hypothetical protein
VLWAITTTAIAATTQATITGQWCREQNLPRS